MICKKCHTNNPPSSVYCESCGNLLIRGPVQKNRSLRRPVLLAGLFALLVAGFFIVKIILNSPDKDMPPDVSATRGGTIQDIPADSEERSLTLGRVVVLDGAAREISGCTAGVFNDSWTSMPVWDLLGGKSLEFQSEGSDQILIKEGLWTSGDPIVLLKLLNNPLGNNVQGQAV